ncbi:hypothetical protein QJS10_CPA10g01897 [Acorus calamus]|uniref:DM2 domain-containing protein n=1 Tax=Acorus calamus TaxID=4465 RepID=A0AAV9DZ08_ACOCL|nr:hypothetical protein QJS10_CPA10g01897 [Acorus calamus]
MKTVWDDDKEITPDSITNYYFIDGNDEPFSYSVLSLLFSDDGQVKAWRMDILRPLPEVLVLTKDEKWIRMAKLIWVERGLLLIMMKEEDESSSDVMGSDDDQESDLFDTVCAIRDNGGELLCCEGICMRSFHPTIKAGGDSYCLSLGYTDAEVEAIQNFLCRNCRFKKHQCFICGKLGSSDKSVGAEYKQFIRLFSKHLRTCDYDGGFGNFWGKAQKHLMDEKLHTPIRNHIEFPDVPKKRKTSFQELRKNVLAKKKKSVSKEMPREEIGVRTKTPKILDKAVRTALQKLKEGSSIEDAKAVCEPEIVNQIIKWRNKFKVYLAPFLHGLRYTSFGRHFTKKEKLQEVVEKLHWYVSDGDMIVDFCCGANDFSCFMKQKLDETGKKCLFKNYDIIQSKNDFGFVKKDWMTVQRNDLSKCSELIIGLNPPFGVKAALANKFIDKALQFKPKLVILIVPEETERYVTHSSSLYITRSCTTSHICSAIHVRLDKKKQPEYDLIWEDRKSLSNLALQILKR